jgi:hypothetical protein
MYHNRCRSSYRAVRSSFSFISFPFKSCVEVGFLKNWRAESSLIFSFEVPSRIQTVREEARNKLGKKDKSLSYLLKVHEQFEW